MFVPTLATVPASYRIVYHEHFTLPFLQWQVAKDFGIEITDPTHTKMILQRV